MVLGVIGLPVQRMRLSSPGKRRPDRIVSAVVSAATLMALVTLIALFAPPVIVEDSTSPPSQSQQQGTATNPEAPGETPPPTSGGGNSGFEFDDNPGAPIPAAPRRAPTPTAEGGPDGFDWAVLRGWARTVLWLLLLALAAVGLRAYRSRPKGGHENEPPAPPLPAAEAEEALEASLSDATSAGRTPREQITVAYRRLLGALNDAGAPRLPFEAPYEHLYRTLGPLGVHPEPMHRLTQLYVLAQFSQQDLREEHRDSAVDTLERCLDSLRNAKAQMKTPSTQAGLANASV